MKDAQCADSQSGHALSAICMAARLRRAMAEGLVRPADSALIFYDLDHLHHRHDELMRAFPDGTQHAVAIKTNPLGGVLRALKAWGSSVEVASWAEALLAQKAGFPADAIIYDSPVKTDQELHDALAAGICINADSLEELHRISGILADHPQWVPPHGVGIRINPQVPQVGEGSVPSLVTASRDAKFGVPLQSGRIAIREAFIRYPWLKGLHVHVSSQSWNLDLPVKGIRDMVDLAQSLDDLGENDNPRVEWLDIGGGLPTPYRESDPHITMGDYVAKLKKACPALFSGKYRLITEFGRYLHAHAGWVVSRVEGVKRVKGQPMILTHVGADLFMRACYNPDAWYHNITVTDARGHLRLGTATRSAVGGPLSFGGDMLARDIALPPVRRGDYLMIHDAGANTFSLWSHHNSRAFPRVIACEGDQLSVIRERQSLEDVVGFWG